MARKRHHVVSRSYLRLFADGKRIQVADRMTLVGKLVGTGDAFVRKHFSSHWDGQERLDVVEDEWGRLENLAMPGVRALLSGDRSAEARDAAKILASIHFARSYTFDQSMALITEQFRVQAPQDMAADPKLQRLWRRHHGRAPMPGEVEAYVEERMDDLFDSAYRIDRMINAHNWAMEKLGPLSTQVITARGRADFVTGDTPFVHFTKNRTGLKDGLALGDAAHLYLALSPRVAVMFTTTDEGDPEIGDHHVVQMNSRVRIAAVAQLACHPSTDLRRALGRS